MSNVEPLTLAYNEDNILSILEYIVKYEKNPPVVVSEPNFSTIGYPVLIGSRAAKWYIPSFREPNDWDFIATASQSILLIKKIKTKSIKLIYYSDIGLKLIGKCIEQNQDLVDFEVELASDKVNFKKVKIEKSDDKGMKIELEKFKDNRSKSSAMMILELCRDVKDRIIFPLPCFPCIVAPLKILEALKASHIYWPDDFYKNIADLHSLRVILGYNNQPMTRPLCGPTRDKQTKLMLKTRIKETEILRGIPGAHINLNKTNEEFLDREDDLFVERVVPHDTLHELVKYGDHPIYEGLKHDKVDIL
jgi:hypothetical protein